jgi:hypothetical protein
MRIEYKILTEKEWKKGSLGKTMLPERKYFVS